MRWKLKIGLMTFALMLTVKQLWPLAEFLPGLFLGFSLT